MFHNDNYLNTVEWCIPHCGIILILILIWSISRVCWYDKCYFNRDPFLQCLSLPLSLPLSFSVSLSLSLFHSLFLWSLFLFSDNINAEEVRTNVQVRLLPFQLTSYPTIVSNKPWPNIQWQLWYIQQWLVKTRSFKVQYYLNLIRFGVLYGLLLFWKQHQKTGSNVSVEN